MLSWSRDLMALCAPHSGGGPLSLALIAAMFLAGLTGGAVHCAPMCGGFVLGQVADRLARVPAHRLCERARLTGGLLPPYHLGRMVTYAALGAASGAVGRVVPALPFTPSVLLAGAAILLARKGLRSVAPGWFPQHSPSRFAPRYPGTVFARIGSRLGRSASGRSGFLLGLLLGFLPCAMLYAALFVAAAMGSAVAGAAATAAFGLGTVPVLAMIGVVGHASRRWTTPLLTGRAGGVVMLANAGLLGFLAAGHL